MAMYTGTYPLDFFIERAHPRDGADIISDRDKGWAGKILLCHRVPSIFRIHLSKAIDIVKT